ncbi:MAG: DNA polymerase III subunit gamma/tau [Erysipelotrichaceae bacterium]|nr:DNA polymerase III subunit gamma/tau [Erysipelotrichaceae bacterium]
MSYLALYRKYRPNNFNDLVGQSEIVDIIRNEILNDKISHAYLFSGPRGTGKTSTAKIIARMINCSNLGKDGVPCGKCVSCLNFNNNSDIVEIDAASNNGVDEIRELRDKVNLVPTFGKYKIYIIDEVHMLTTQAFNALLKTLEEPPSHAIFILATTEFYKIPITVVSRCQKFQFLKFSNEEIVKKLIEISSKESIDVGADVLFEIARLSDGGLRDAINMLDQLSSFKGQLLTIQDVYKLNGVISYEEFRNLLKYIYSNKIVDIIEFLDNVDRNGKSFDRFIEDLLNFMKEILIYKNTSIFNSSIVEKNEALVELSSIFSEQVLYNFIISLNELSFRIKNSSFAKILLTAEFIKFSNQLVESNFSIIESEEKKLNYQESNCNFDNKINDNKSEINKLKTNSFFYMTDKLKKIRINNTFATASKSNKQKFKSKWDFVKEKLSNDSNYLAIAGMMNDVEILVVGEENVIFLAQYDSLLERLFSQVLLIEQLLFEVFNIPYKVVFLLEDEWNFERENYILNLKSGKKYVYLDEKSSDKNEMIDSFTNTDNDIDKIVSILGSDVISYE